MENLSDYSEYVLSAYVFAGACLMFLALRVINKFFKSGDKNES